MYLKMCSFCKNSVYQISKNFKKCTFLGIMFRPYLFYDGNFCYSEYNELNMDLLAFSVPVVLLNSPNLSPFFSLNKSEGILVLIFSSLLCLIIFSLPNVLFCMCYVKRS